MKLLTKMKIFAWGSSAHRSVLRSLACRCHTAASTDQSETSLINTQQTASDIFDLEHERQMSLIPRAEKIEVNYEGNPEPCLLIMNRNISTPYNCAMHIGEHFMFNGSIALVNNQPWDMHRPLEGNCTLKFITYLDKQPTLANHAYWRTCSFLLGYTLKHAFKPQHNITLHSWPKINVSTGSFVYDAVIQLSSGTAWTPLSSELQALSRQIIRLKTRDLHFQTLLVTPHIAKQMFADNRFKISQIDSIAASKSISMSRNITASTDVALPLAESSPTSLSTDVLDANDSRIRVYKLDDHVDISVGPMISTTLQLGSFQITGVYLTNPKHNLYRVQGLSIPNTLQLHQWTWQKLVDRASQFNSSPIPKISD